MMVISSMTNKDTLRFVLAGDNDVADIQDFKDILSTGRVVSLFVNGSIIKRMRFNSMHQEITVFDASTGIAIEDLEVLETELLKGSVAVVSDGTGTVFELKIK